MLCVESQRPLQRRKKGTDGFNDYHLTDPLIFLWQQTTFSWRTHMKTSIKTTSKHVLLINASSFRACK